MSERNLASLRRHLMNTVAMMPLTYAGRVAALRLMVV